MPVYNSATYDFDSAESIETAFEGKYTDYTYSRIANPTLQYFEYQVKIIKKGL